MTQAGIHRRPRSWTRVSQSMLIGPALHRYLAKANSVQGAMKPSSTDSTSTGQQMLPTHCAGYKSSFNSPTSPVAFCKQKLCAHLSSAFCFSCLHGGRLNARCNAATSNQWEMLKLNPGFRINWRPARTTVKPAIATGQSGLAVDPGWPIHRQCSQHSTLFLLLAPLV